ncbi:DUF6053 domain-containing protein [Lysobacter enzymogenes]|uniref:DUF6053 domain-containing protein n=1 Tax=Lysobacter enzymogenes TaxID=69 RepID=UPI003CCE4FF1
MGLRRVGEKSVGPEGPPTTAKLSGLKPSCHSESAGLENPPATARTPGLKALLQQRKRRD